MGMRADYVVVGAGVHGASAAWHLARAKREVLVLEAATVASGASGGLGERGVRANGRDPRELPLLPVAYEVWDGLADLIGGSTGYRRLGQLELIEREEDVAPAMERVELQRRHAIPTELLDAAAVRRLEPEVSEAIVAATYCPHDGVADHTATTIAVAGAAQHEGAELLEHTKVTGLRTRAGAVVAVRTGADEVVVGRGVVIACNAAASELLAPLGVHVPTFPVLPQVLVTEPIEPSPVRHLVGHAHRPLAIKALPDRRLMITGGRLGAWDERDQRGVVDAAQVAANLADAVAVFPRLAGAGLSRTVADRAESVSPDMIPIVDRVPGRSNAFFATGWSGHGWAIAPVVSELLVKWLVSGERPGLLAPFALNRFASSSS
jgi:sarcosine oxidase, subunit beta